MGKALWRTTEVGCINDEAPIRLIVSGLNDDTLWLTGLKGSVEPNFQLMYSFGPKAFINAFNQRLSMFSISGIYVPSTCNGGGAKGEPAFVGFYRKRNIVSSDDPTKITFDGITITGWFVRLVIGEVTKQGIDGHLFSLDFLGRLKKAGESASGDGGSEEGVSFGSRTIGGPVPDLSNTTLSGNSIKSAKLS